VPGRSLLALPGMVVMVSSAVSSVRWRAPLGSLSAETTDGAETHRGAGVIHSGPWEVATLSRYSTRISDSSDQSSWSTVWLTMRGVSTR
jgi:hypothetical protein